MLNNEVALAKWLRRALLRSPLEFESLKPFLGHYHHVNYNNICCHPIFDPLIFMFRKKTKRQKDLGMRAK